MDIGTWSGMYTYIFEALGFDFYGLEPRKPAVEFAQTKGVNVLHGSFPENIPPTLLNRKYHLIAMIEMIYYLHDLKQSLLQAREMREDNGVLLIKSHQGYSTYYDADYRHSYFNRYGDNVQGIPTLNSLQYWLGASGFKGIKIAASTDNRVLEKLNRTAVPMESADRFYILAGKALELPIHLHAHPPQGSHTR